MKIILEREISISTEVASFLVSVLETGVGDNIKEDVRANRLVKPNSTPSRIWDFINRDVEEQADKHGCLCNLTKRGPWTMSVLYDSSSKQIITLMREKRFEELQRGKKNRKSMHYLDAFSQCLNGELCAPSKQQSIFEADQVSDKTLYEANKVVEKMTASFEKDGEIEHHVLVLFSSEGYQLTSVRAVIIDSDLEIVCSSNWSEYISASESVVAEVVTEEDLAYANPRRGLKLNAKATQRQTTQARIREKEEQDSKSRA